MLGSIQDDASTFFVTALHLLLPLRARTHRPPASKARHHRTLLPKTLTLISHSLGEAIHLRRPALLLNQPLRLLVIPTFNLRPPDGRESALALGDILEAICSRLGGREEEFLAVGNHGLLAACGGWLGFFA